MLVDIQYVYIDIPCVLKCPFDIPCVYIYTDRHLDIVLYTWRIDVYRCISKFSVMWSGFQMRPPPGLLGESPEPAKTPTRHCTHLGPRAGVRHQAHGMIRDAMIPALAARRPSPWRWCDRVPPRLSQLGTGSGRSINITSTGRLAPTAPPRLPAWEITCRHIK